MKPLTKETVEMVRQGLLNSEWCGFSKRDTVNQLCDLALKSFAVPEEGTLQGWAAALEALARNDCAGAYHHDELTHMKNIIANLRGMVKDASAALALSPPSPQKETK